MRRQKILAGKANFPGSACVALALTVCITTDLLASSPVEVPKLVVTVTPANVRTGAIATVKVEGSPSPKIRIFDRDVPCVAEGDSCSGLFGVDIDAALGVQGVEVTAGQLTARTEFTIVDGKYKEERLTLPPSKVSGFDEKTLAQIGTEKAVLDALWSTTTEERLWSEPFAWPVKGKLGSLFGERRIINGEPKSPHTGVDQKAKTGEIIRAANNGRVVFTGEQFFSGNAVILDHGHGLYTMYFHMSKIAAKPGALVKRGDEIGRVGATGRASGPHLHWGVRVLGARVSAQELPGLAKGP